MKWLLNLALVISLGVNGYFIYGELHAGKKNDLTTLVNKRMLGELSNTRLKDGIRQFKENIKIDHPELTSCRYYYINIWTNWCAPCIKEMPWLDSIAGTLRKDVAYIFTSDLSDATANNCIKKQHYNFKNFILINNMNDFISSIFNERGLKTKAFQ